VNSFRLQITTPAAILVDEPDVASLRAEDTSGGFGLLAGSADFLTALPSSVVAWRGERGGWRYCAIGGGVLTASGGERVDIACRQGVLGADLATLKRQVVAMRGAELDAARRARVESVRLHAQAVRQLMRLLGPEAGR
jgi:F-type H+-transporting ATPase subunit epsilon